MDERAHKLRHTEAAIKAAEAVTPGNELQQAAAADMIALAIALDAQELSSSGTVDLSSPTE